MDERMKIVNFEWCNKCKHNDKKENEDPCYECLDEPANANSRRPVYFEEAKK